MEGTTVFAAIVVALIAYMGFRQWLRHHRRVMLHRERLAAIEKGLELPALEQGVAQRNWNVQRTLLFAGLIWISLGITIFAVLVSLGDNLHLPAQLMSGTRATHALPLIGLAPLLIGVSHLVVYIVGRRKDQS